MAICLRRNFRSCSSLALIGRRNQHSNSFDYKTSNSVYPFMKEMGYLDLSPLSLTRRYEFNFKPVTNLPVLSDSVLCAQECKAYKKVQIEHDSLKRGDKTQLQHVTNVLIEDLPELFNRNMNYKIYHPKMIFENNIRGTKTIGLDNYMREMFMLKVIGNIRFSQIKFTILKITDHPEDGTVRVRWRIVGISQLKNILRMLKHISHKYVEPEGWYDGFSIFYVRSDGLIHKHIVDKMIPDDSNEENLINLRNQLVVKMALAVGIPAKNFPFSTVSFDKIQNKPTCSSKLTYSLVINRPLKVKFCDSVLVNKLNQQN